MPTTFPMDDGRERTPIQEIELRPIEDRVAGYSPQTIAWIERRKCSTLQSAYELAYRVAEGMGIGELADWVRAQRYLKEDAEANGCGMSKVWLQVYYAARNVLTNRVRAAQEGGEA